MMILLVIASWPFPAMADMTIRGPVFSFGIQSTKWVLFEISLNFLRCCSWLRCASFCFFSGFFIQRFASGKMRALEVKWQNMSPDLHTGWITCAWSGQDMGQNRMRRVEKGNMKFLLHIYSFGNLCSDIYSTTFYPFHPEKDSCVRGKNWPQRQNRPSERQYLGPMPSVHFGDMRAEIGRIATRVVVFG